jgi:hypothetical protein
MEETKRGNVKKVERRKKKEERERKKRKGEFNGKINAK